MQVVVKCTYCHQPVLSFETTGLTEKDQPSSTIVICLACERRIQVRWTKNWKHEERTIQPGAEKLGLVGKVKTAKKSTNA